jgi:hypothetical protein
LVVQALRSERANANGRGKTREGAGGCPLMSELLLDWHPRQRFRTGKLPTNCQLSDQEDIRQAMINPDDSGNSIVVLSAQAGAVRLRQ